VNPGIIFYVEFRSRKVVLVISCYCLPESLQIEPSSVPSSVLDRNSVANPLQNEMAKFIFKSIFNTDINI
jgi:hypothetical protein